MECEESLHDELSAYDGYLGYRSGQKLTALLTLLKVRLTRHFLNGRQRIIHMPYLLQIILIVLEEKLFCTFFPKRYEVELDLLMATIFNE